MLSQSELNLIMQGLDEWLIESIIQRVFSAQRPYEWCVQCRRPGETKLLTVCVDPELARVHLAASKPSQPEHPSTFTMLLRKWLQGAVIRRVMAPRDERLVRLEGDVRDPDAEEAQDEPAQRRTIALVIELFGRHANLFLLGEEDKILGQSAADRLPGRALRPGDRYLAPPRGDRGAPERSKNRFADFETLDLEQRQLAITERFESELAEERDRQAVERLTRRLKRHSKKLRRLIGHIEGDLERVMRADSFKRYGELLQSAYGRVERGAESVRVADYYAEGMPEVEVPLDGSLSLQGNIDKYFKQYKRLHDARDQIEERLLEAMERLEEVEMWRKEELPARLARRGEEDWSQLEETLKARGLLGEPKQRPAERGRDGQVKRAPYRLYTGSKGSRIVVGKGAKGNDEVSLKVARGRDIWLHARDWAGAHVILRMERGDQAPEQLELLEAATLAAYFCKGREDTRVEVTYTQAKYVRKPKGYPPGLVTVAGGSTIAVVIEAPRLERVLATEQKP